MRTALQCGVLLAFCSLSGQAAFTVISSPDATYLTTTTKLDFSGLADFTSFNSVTNGVETLTSSNSLTKLSVPGSWGSWSSPPNSESATPAVAFNSSASDTLTLAPGVGTFGFELEPNVRGTFTVTADYFNGATLLGTISRSISGNAGARLVGASDTDINKVVVSVSGGGSQGFAMAQFRYAPVASVPEPGAIILLSTVVGLLAWRYKPRTA
jgi:hypothetical protein